MFDDAKVWKVAVTSKFLGYSAQNCDELLLFLPCIGNIFYRNIQ